MNSIQKKVFLEEEADSWFERNLSSIKNFNSEDDKVWDLLKKYKIKPNKCLEIGCSAGHRINALKKVLPHADFFGIEPSTKAIAYGKEMYKNINLNVGTIDDLSLFEDQKFDAIIIGFLLYVLDRELLFKAISEVDRVLKNEGYLIIIDFQTLEPVKVKYHHVKKVEAYSYKQNYEDIFLSSCMYHLIEKNTLNHDLTKTGYDSSNDYYNQYVMCLLKKDINASYE